MFSFLQSKTRYSSVEEANVNYDEELKMGDHQHLSSRYITLHVGLCGIIGLALLLFTSIASTWILLFRTEAAWNHISAPAPAAVAVTCITTSIPTGDPWACVRPAIRREWRTLSETDQQEYITAVQCLATKPSKLRNNGTLYDDFPQVHKTLSAYTHKSAPFFPWHRYYIHLYEKMLRDDCEYSQSLPYWDWSLDWEDFGSAPVWDSKSGFGGDGNAIGETTVGDGRCVTEGPFAGLEAMFYDDAYQPHCLSRGFSTGTDLADLSKLIQPNVIEQILREPEYETFTTRLESNGHHFLSGSVRGDLSKFTGPNDPVFFLHHTNLDRLFWQWQQLDPDKRLTAYTGRANGNSMNDASLTDMLDMGGLGRSIQVSDVMETDAGLFCYKY